MRQTLAFVPLSPRASRTEPPLRLPHSTGCCYDPLSLSPHSLRQPSFPLVPGSYGEAVAAPRPARTPRSRGPAPGSVRRPLVAGGASSLLLAPAPPLGIIDGDVSARRGCHYHSVPASSKDECDDIISLAEKGLLKCMGYCCLKCVSLCINCLHSQGITFKVQHVVVIDLCLQARKKLF